jgi:hypothetical protein
MSDAVLRSFTFEVMPSKEPTVELVQLISKCLQSYELKSGGDIPAVLAYFNKLYGVS